MINDQDVADTIERKLEELRSRADPRAFDQAVELLQLVSELYVEGLARLMKIVEDRAPEVTASILADDLLTSLLIANGLHPDDLAVRIADALDKVRPFLRSHGGDVEVLEIDERVGAVRLRLLGSCDGCPSSAVTLRTTVERAISDAAPEISIIDVEDPNGNAVEAPLRAGLDTPVLLGSKPAGAFDPATGCGAMP